MSEIITLHIQNLRLNAIIGILEQERKIPQEVAIDAQISYVYTDTFLDYVALSELITSHLQAKAYGLLENALLDIAAALKAKNKNITRIELCIKKPQILQSCVVGASIVKEYPQRAGLET